MNEKFDIYADSSANLTEKMIADCGIKVISYECTCDGKKVICYSGRPFSDDARDFYGAMSRGAEVSTSLISSQRFYDAAEQSLKEGRDALIITISAQVSGTHKQACLAAEQLEKDYPGRRVYVFDSANSGFGEGLLAVQAARMKNMGESAEVCFKQLEISRFRLNSYFTVADLKYLKKG